MCILLRAALMPMALYCLAILAVLFAPSSAIADEFGRYRCKAEEVFTTDKIGKTWENAELFYDADAGTLDGSFDLKNDGLRSPPSRLFSLLKVETPPSGVQNLHAVQFKPAGNKFYVPIVAWLMIETIDSAVAPRFQFFSSGLRGLATGRCLHSN